MSKVKEAYMLAEELVLKIADGLIDLDEAKAEFSANYLQLGPSEIDFIFDDVLEVNT